MLAQSCLAYVVQTYGPLLTTGAILISAAVAVLAIRANGKAAKRRATIDLVLHQKQNKILVDARKLILDLHDGKAQFTKFALLENAKEQETLALIESLNAYEFVATGIREGAFDEATFKRLRHSVTVRDWAAWETFVSEFRKARGQPTVYREFEWLAKRWIKDPLK